VPASALRLGVLSLVALLQPVAAAEPGVSSTWRAAALQVGLDDTAQPLVKVAGVLLCLCILWMWVCSGKGRDVEGSGQTPEKLKVFTKWAQQQIEESRPEVHRQILDDVISTFATYAQHIEQGSTRAERRAAEVRLKVLMELLELPVINASLRRANWAWLQEWDQKLLERRDARLRCTVVFPTICTAARLQAENSAQACTPRNLSYLAAWCSDFLYRQDVCDFLGISDSPTRRESNLQSTINFMTTGPGALDSESSEDEEEEISSQVKQPSGRSDEAEAKASTEFQVFTRRKFNGQEHCWDDPDGTEALVRGAHYLQDRVKIHSKSSMLELAEVDLVKTWDEMVHYSINDRGKIPGLREAGDNRFYFTINFRLVPIQLALIFAVPRDADWLNQPEGRVFQRFLESSDEAGRRGTQVGHRVLLRAEPPGGIDQLHFVCSRATPSAVANRCWKGIQPVAVLHLGGHGARRVAGAHLGRFLDIPWRSVEASSALRPWSRSRAVFLIG